MDYETRAIVDDVWGRSVLCSCNDERLFAGETVEDHIHWNESIFDD